MEYEIGTEEVTVDLTTFSSSPETETCWDYDIFVLGSGLPVSDPDAIQFDTVAKTVTIHSTAATSVGDYHIAIKAFDKNTGDRKGWHQFMIRFLPGTGDTDSTDELEDGSEEDVDAECQDYTIDRVFYPSNQQYEIGQPEVTVNLDAFTSGDQYKDCWEYQMFVLRDELPDDDKSAISFDITSRTARIFSDKAESAGDYHVGISIVDK